MTRKELVNPFEAYLVDLLQNNIIVNGKTIPVMKRRPQLPRLPSITLDVQDVSTDGVYRALQETMQLIYERSTTIQLDVWSLDEEERLEINKQILDCWYKEQNQHYMYCSKYEDGDCLTTHSACAAKNTKSKQCPRTGTFGYEPLMLRHGLLKGSVNIDPPFDLDEYEEKQPILHSVFRCEGGYRDYVTLQGDPIEQIEYEDITII